MDHSPIAGGTQDRQIEMTFAAVLEEVVEGRKVRRLSWEDEGIYGALDKEILVIYRTDDKMLHPWIISLADMRGKDWVVVKEAATIH